MVAAAEALRPLIVKAREEIEKDQRLPAALVAAMDEAGLFRMYAPRSLGGPEVDPLTAFRVVEHLSIADGSVGWCCLIAAAISLYSGWLGSPAAREIVGSPPSLRGAGSFRPKGTARITDGGYLVNGRWDFASGCLHANWLFVNCVVTDGDGPRYREDGLPELRMMSAPISAATVHDNWSVIGLRGTGSNDVSVEDLFVPAERTFVLSEEPVETAPLFNARAAMATTFTPLAANALGMARGAMDAFIELATSSATTMNPDLLRDRPQVQLVVGEAEAIISGARAYVLHAVGEMWEGVLSGKPDLSDEVRQSRLAVTHAIHESARAIDMLYHGSGSNAVRRGNLLERYFRDIHAAMMHAAGLPANFEQGGRVVLGLPPGAPGW
jgi:alkylation response protein AidB-like acyl-CoA dehydrogenase